MSEALIAFKLKGNRHSGVEFMYDKYSKAMYGLICTLTNDKDLAEKLFVTSFIKLIDKQISSPFEYVLFPDIMRHTYVNSIKELQETPHTANVLPFEMGTIMHFLCLKCNSAKDVAYILGIPEEEVGKRLRSESLKFRQLDNL